MTTESWNTPIHHTNDAGFRAWGAEVQSKLAAIGLVQTADTGQINWVTVTRPGTNTMGGYEIWRFDDTLQGSAPIYFKLEYGTGAAATNPAAFITVGTGSNGSGTITGQSTARVACNTSWVATDTISNRQSYACAVDGAAWIATKYAASGVNLCSLKFSIKRTCDATGAPTATGFVLYTGLVTNSINGIPVVQAVRTASPAVTFTANTLGLFTVVVHGVTDSVDGSNTQAYLHWMPTPKVLPVFAAATMIASEAAFGTSIVTTLVGTTARTYLSIGTGFGQAAPGTASASLLLIFE